MSPPPETPPPPTHLWKEAIGDNAKEVEAMQRREQFQRSVRRMFNRPFSEQIGRYGGRFSGNSLMMICWFPGILLGGTAIYSYRTTGQLPWGGISLFGKKGEAEK